MTQNYYSGLTSELLKVQRSKQHSPIFKTFLNNNKISIILPLFYENEFVPDFKKKAGLLDSFFAGQCSLVSNNNKLLSKLHYFMEKSFSTIKFSSNYIFDMIQLLDPNKAHSHDMIIIQMSKTCRKSICRPLELISMNAYRTAFSHQN